LRREPRLIAAYHGLLQVAQMTGDEELLTSSAEAALELDSADQWIYDDWIDAVMPQWGGSIEAMDAVAHRAVSHVSRNPLLARTPARSLCYQAKQYYCATCKNDFPQALALYRKAAEFGPVACFLTYAPGAAAGSGDYGDAVRYESQTYRFFGKTDDIVYRADYLSQIGHADWAREDLARMIAEYPKYTSALEHLAYLDEHAGNPQAAAKGYARIIEIDANHERAKLELSRLYMSSVPARDKAKALIEELLARNPKLARAWENRAMLVCNESDAQCRESLEKFLELANPDDAYEKKEIPRAKAKLAELGALGH